MRASSLMQNAKRNMGKNTKIMEIGKAKLVFTVGSLTVAFTIIIIFS